MIDLSNAIEMDGRVYHRTDGLLVQGVKDKKKLLASDLYQSMKICIHG